MKNKTNMRLQMLENGWSPLPNIDKMCVLTGWPTVEINEKTIRSWDRMHNYEATGLRLDNGLCAIDFDINHEKAEDLYVFLCREFPELDTGKGVLRRAGKGRKEAWFVRTSEPFARIAGSVFTTEGGTGEGYCVEVFGGGSPRQFGAIGWHTKDKLKYRWHAGGSPLDIPLNDLPLLTKFDIFELVRLVNEWMIENGFEVYSDVNAGETEPDHVYDLTDDMVFETRTDGEVKLNELCDLLAGRSGHYYCSASFIDGPVARNKRRCSVSSDRDGGVAIWDSMTCLTHHETALERAEIAENRMSAVAARLRALGAIPEEPPAVEVIDQERFQHYHYTEDDVVRQNEANIAIRLDADVWRGVFSFSEFDHDIWVMQPMPGDDRGVEHPRRLTDGDLLAVQRAVQREEFPSASMLKVRAAVAMAAFDNARNAPKEYLEGLTWDNTERLTTIAETYLGTEVNGDRAYVEASVRKWMIGAVARIMYPGCKVDHMLILQGPQGAGKSSFFATLGGVWFSDDMPPVGSKDAKEWIRGRWIAEIAELSAMSGKDIEHVKAFLTTTSDRFRKAFGHVVETVPRQAVFGGSTNDYEYLMDTTGGRRFWPVKIGRIDLDGLARDRDQLWAEAVAALSAGERWHLDRDLDAGIIKEAGDAQESSRALYLEEEPIRRWLRREKAEKGLLAYDVAVGALKLDVSQLKGTGVMRHTIPRVMALLGWVKGRRTERGFVWIRGPEAQPYKVIDKPLASTAVKAAARALKTVDTE